MSANIAVFVPHNGCRHQCSFCNQFSITSQPEQPTAQTVTQTVESALFSLGEQAASAEIAFFGGSFTAVEHIHMLELLEAAHPFVADGRVRGIRVSTRPDAVGDEVLDLLARYGTTTVELGAQSMCDDVLLANGRGHTADDVVCAAKRVREHGFALGLQMMTGLPESDDRRDVQTGEALIALHPDCVRIYPTVVLKGTRLERLFAEGKYCPPTLEEAVSLCCRLLDRFEEHRIPVIRLGLHAIDPESYVAGPWHPAFGELCESQRFFERAVRQMGHPGRYRICVPPRAVSKAVGQNRRNIGRFRALGMDVSIQSDTHLNQDEFIVEEVKF